MAADGVGHKCRKRPNRSANRFRRKEGIKNQPRICKAFLVSVKVVHAALNGPVLPGRHGFEVETRSSVTYSVIEPT